MNKNKQIKYFLDSALGYRKLTGDMDLKRARAIAKQQRGRVSASTLFSKGKRSTAFFTEDSKLYITPKEYELQKNGVALDRADKKWDSLSSRIVKDYVRYAPRQKNVIYENLLEKYTLLNEELAWQSKNFLSHFSMVRVWNMSMVAAILFGMFTMTMIYRYLGQGASAESGAGNLPAESAQTATLDPTSDAAQVLDAENVVTNQDNGQVSENGNLEYIEQVIQNLEEGEKEVLEKKMLEMVKGHPIEKMIPYIMEKDQVVAAFLIGIAKKESNWGERVPVLNGQDCYNYWGYRGQRRLMGTGGHTCFNSRKDAVDTVAKRIEWLVNNNKLNTPEKMIIWKCGSSCAGHSNYSVQKWISDVDMYFKKLND